MNEIENALGVQRKETAENDYFVTVGENGNPIPENRTRHKTSAGDNSAETIIRIIAYIVLVLGIIGSLISFFVVGKHDFGYGFMLFLSGIISSVIIWAASMIIINISTNIREIKHLLQENAKNKEKLIG